MLWDGGIVRIRKRALRHFARDWRPAFVSSSGKESGSYRCCTRHIVPATGRTRDRPSAASPGRSSATRTLIEYSKMLRKFIESREQHYYGRDRHRESFAFEWG